MAGHTSLSLDVVARPCQGHRFRMIMCLLVANQEETCQQTWLSLTTTDGDECIFWPSIVLNKENDEWIPLFPAKS